MNPVTIDDITDRLRRPPTNDLEVIAWASMLADAWAEVTALEPSVDDRVTAGTLSTAVVRKVLCAMVIRVIRNPDGKFQESIDDYSWTRDKAVSGGLLYLSDAERNLLRVRRGSAFTITPGL